jgi:hypothetical protein
MLILLEWQMMDVKNGGDLIDRKKPTKEHIMPREYKKWEGDIINWNQGVNKNNIAEKHQKFLSNVGNWFILYASKNTSIKNYKFEEKQKKLSSIKSPLYENNDNDIDVKKKTKWTFKDIENRGKKLIELICSNIFKF